MYCSMYCCEWECWFLPHLPPPTIILISFQFRTYETLRREHDSQIIKMAMDTGLRISPEQWSTLLYGDHKHKSEMQSIIDKVEKSTAGVA